MGGETARRAAEKGYLPRWFGGDGNRPLSNPLINGAVMSVLAFISMQPTLGEQFGVLVGVTSVLTLSIYGMCAIGLFRASPALKWRALAAVALVFSVFAVAAAAAAYVVPTLVFFAVIALAWLVVRRRQAAAVDPGTPAL